MFFYYKAAILQSFLVSKCTTNLLHFKFYSKNQALLSNEPPIVVEVKNKVQWIRLNRPKQFNAMTDEAYAEMIKALCSATENDHVKIVVITGSGKYFSSGRDLNNHHDRAAKLNCDLLTSAKLGCDLAEGFVNAFIDFPKPLIGAVNGPAYGIMVTTLPFYEYIFASNTASFTTPFSRIGITPEGCSSYTFPRILGPKVAAKMLCFSETLTAEKALQLEFISEVVSPDALESKVTEWLHDPKKGVLATCNAQAMTEAKALMRNEENRKMLKEINRQEIEVLKKMYESGDVFEHLEKFINKLNI